MSTLLRYYTVDTVDTVSRATGFKVSGFHDSTISRFQGFFFWLLYQRGSHMTASAVSPHLHFPSFSLTLRSRRYKKYLLYGVHTQKVPLPPYLSYALLCRRFSLDHFIDRTCLCTASLPCMPGGKRTKQLCYFLFPISYLLFLVLFAETLLIFTYLLL